MPEIFVGTSGWVYDWNLGSTLDWYVEFSGLNAVELNASFYRFPYKNQVLGWSRRGSKLRWSVKVHRSVTHASKMSERALDTWFRFSELFKPLEESIDFYLFQLPPNFSCRNELLKRVEVFYELTKLKQRFAIEFRHPSCFTERIVEWGRGLGLTLVSVDSPMVSWIAKTSDNVYLRLHGRGGWYAYEYSYEELRELAEKVLQICPEKVYVFFNNDHWMLENARVMLSIFEGF
ncbi:MAG: DUF72 domain-containing protein [Thermoprotei archaeon]